MAAIFVFNNDDGGLERYSRGPSEPMPYTEGNSLLVSDFLGRNETGWTDVATMRAWNSLCGVYGKPIQIDRAFVRIEQIAPDGLATPQHLAGTAFEAGSQLCAGEREALREALAASGAFSVVQTRTDRRNTVCFDKRYLPSGTFATAGFPVLYNGCRNHYVLTLQSLLNAAGQRACVLDGIFGAQTARALRDYQRRRRLPENGIAGRLEWASLLGERGVMAGM